MKVILSVDPVRFPLTGIGRYAYELAKGLQDSGEIEELRFLSGTRFLSGLPEPSDSSDRTHKLKRLVQSSGLAMETYRRLMPLLKKSSLKEYKDFIYHGPNFFLPPFPGRKVATFHDLSPFKWADCFDPAKVKYLQTELCMTLNTADALITDSEFIRYEIAEFAGWPLEKIHAIPLAAGPEFKPRTDSEAGRVLERYGLGYKGYSLFVGTIEPRKNISRLLEAYSLLPRSVRQRWPLVITGYQGWKSDDIHDQIKKADSEGWARYLGFLPAEELPLLYSASRLVVFPSLYEGFGLPVLEAMQSGVPVVCSNRASIPEVAGNAALMFDALDIEEIADCIQIMLLDDRTREDYREAGQKRARSYTWQACCSATLDVYKTLN